MKYISVILLALTFLVADKVWASDIYKMTEKIKSPITVVAGKAKLMNVVFNHTSHRGLNCFTCHHEKDAVKGRYVSCSNCHTGAGRMKDPKSKFMAFHAKDSAHSCYSCHLNKAIESPERYGKLFVNCRPCHYRPQLNAQK
ncbi:MAG: cytochrome c3 family protein [Desulfovibrionaceae bacterium]|nr:cytochrome c3 family protein [Desulfovibrionaceae bacterium]